MPPGSSPTPSRSPEQDPAASQDTGRMRAFTSWFGMGEEPGEARREHLGERLDALRTDERTRSSATVVLGLANIDPRDRARDIDPSKPHPLIMLDLMHATRAAVRHRWRDQSPGRTPENRVRGWLAGVVRNPDSDEYVGLPAHHREYLQNLEAEASKSTALRGEVDALLVSVARLVAQSMNNPREGMYDPVFRKTETVLREYLQAARSERRSAPRDYMFSAAAALSTALFVLQQTAERHWGIHRRGATSGEAKKGTVVLGILTAAGAAAVVGYQLWATHKGLRSGGATPPTMPDYPPGTGLETHGTTPTTPTPTVPAPPSTPNVPVPAPADAHRIADGETLSGIARDALRAAHARINDDSIREVMNQIAKQNHLENINRIRAGDTLNMGRAHEWLRAHGGAASLPAPTGGAPNPDRVTAINEHVREQWQRVTDVNSLAQRIDARPPQSGEGLLGYFERVAGVESLGARADLAHTLATDSQLAGSRQALLSGSRPVTYVYDGELRLNATRDFTAQQASQLAHAIARAAQRHQADMLRLFAEDSDLAS